MVKMVLMAPLVLLVVLLVELVAKEVPVVLPVTLDLVAVAAQVELALEELGDCVPLGGDAQQALEGRELTRLLNRFLSGQPAAQRQVFLARYWYGAAVKDIARQFGYSESKVKSMLYRTREKLRLTLEKEGY